MNLDKILKDIQFQEQLRRERINNINESIYEHDQDNSPTKKPFLENNSPCIQINESTSLEKEQSLETPNTRKNRLAALAEQYNNWENESKVNFSTRKFASPNISSPNSNKMTSNESTADTRKNIFVEESKLHSNLENISPNKKMYIESSNEICKVLFMPTTTIDYEKAITANENNSNSGSNNKDLNNITIQSEKKFIANANLLIKSNNNDKNTKNSPAATCENKLKNDQLDFSIDEPTRKPVSERLNAWKNKVESNTTPTTVTKRVNSFEKKIFSANKTKTISPRYQPNKSPQYNNVRLETKSQISGFGCKITNEELIHATTTGLRKKNSSIKTNNNQKKISPKNVNIVKTNVGRTSPKTSFNVNKIVKNSPKMESNVSEVISVARVDKIDSIVDKEKKGLPICKMTDDKKEKMRDDFENKLKAMGFDVDVKSKCAEINLPKQHVEKITEITQEKLNMPQSTPKGIKTFSAGKTPPAKNSLYTLLRKSDQVEINQINNNMAKLAEPNQFNVEYLGLKNNIEHSSTKKNNFIDSFDSVDSDDVQPNTKIKSAVKFGSTTVKEYVPTTDADTTNENIASDIEQPNLDITTDDENDELNKNIDSQKYLLSFSGEEDEESESNEDERQVVSKLDLSDLLDKEQNETCDISKKMGRTSLADSRPTQFGDQQPIVNNCNSDQINQIASVVMRKKNSVARRRSSLESFKKPRGYISIQEYRRQTRPKSQPPQNRIQNNLVQNYENQRNTVAVQDDNGAFKRLYPVLPTENHLEKKGCITDKERLHELEVLIHQEQVVIQQASNALNKCCHVQSVFASSPEAVECHRLLLLACKKRESYLQEMQIIRREGMSSFVGNEALGTLDISCVRIPLKSDFLARMGSPLDTTIHYFILIFRGSNHQIFFSPMVSTHDWNSKSGEGTGGRGYINFQGVITFKHVTNHFAIDIEIYGMSMSKPMEPTSPKKKKNGTPRKLLTPRMSRKLESPAGPMTVRSTNFMHITTLRINKTNMQRQLFSLERIAMLCPLQSSLSLNLTCTIEESVSFKGFLTMFEESCGLGAWHRRWCHLRNEQIMYWTYPNDENFKAPIGVIDLKLCKNRSIGNVARELCARPYTFEIITQRNSVNARYWLSADTREEKENWIIVLNKSLTNAQTWRN